MRVALKLPRISFHKYLFLLIFFYAVLRRRKRNFTLSALSGGSYPAPSDGYTSDCGQGGNRGEHSAGALKSCLRFAQGLCANHHDGVELPRAGGAADAAFKTALDLINYGKANPDTRTFETNGEGAFLHFATELFRKEAAFNYQHVPIETSGLKVTDLIGSRIDAALGANS